MRELINIVTETTEETAADVYVDRVYDGLEAGGMTPPLEVSLVAIDDHKVEIISILNRHSKGQGVGSSALALMTRIADHMGITLVLSPASDADGEDGGLTFEELVDWYMRYGFEIAGSSMMTRTPDR